MKILITGIAGSGKTTISNRLKSLGYCATDLDTNGTCAWVNKKTGIETDYREASGPDWIAEHRWQVVIPKLQELLSSFTAENIFVAGKVSRTQVGKMKEIFDVIILLQPDDSVIDSRLALRTSNHKNFAKTDQERKAIILDRKKFEKNCIDSGVMILKNNGDVEQIVKEILGILNEKSNKI